MSVCCVKRLPQRPDEQAIWTNCYFRKLANLYRKSPCLWKKDEKNYLKSERRHRAYARIHRAMNLPCVTLVETVLKIREMRRLYVNELKRLLQAEESGEYCCAISLPWFYDLHRFLYPYLDYDEAIELHTIGETFRRPREADKRKSYRDASKCSCIRCPLSGSGQGRSKNYLLGSTRTFTILNSISSPAVSLREVKTRPRTCPRSCSRITDTRKRPDKYRSCTVCVQSNSRHHQAQEHPESTAADELTRARQGRSCEFKILGLGGATSSSNSYDTQSDQLEAFSKIVAHCLKKLGKPYAEEAQVEIQQVLENMLNKSRCNSPCNKACKKNLPP